MTRDNSPSNQSSASKISLGSSQSTDQNFIDTPTYALVGNPNSGKTTLFNALTGLNQKVGNYAGVTVDKKRGLAFSQHGKSVILLDLPGSYSISSEAPDSHILLKSLLSSCNNKAPDCILFVVDATNLERNLYFATQIIELGLPLILVLNMADEFKRKGISIDAQALSEALGVPVITTTAQDSHGIFELKIALGKPIPMPSPWRAGFPSLKTEALYTQLKDKLPSIFPSISESQAHTYALLILSGAMIDNLPTSFVKWVNTLKNELSTEEPNWQESLVSHRYRLIHDICRFCKKSDVKSAEKTFTDKIDSILLHPVWGWVGLFTILGVFFYTIFSLAEYPMSWIELLFEKTGEYLHQVLPHGSLTDLIIEGVISGIGSVLVFLPQILILTFFIGLLESTGYMARVAFMLDKPMSKAGLSGQSFIPFLTSHACAIPAVLGTRIIASPKERLTTILITPFASCSARLPVYFLMISLMVPAGPYSSLYKTGLLIFAYALGAVVAFCSAYLFRKTLLKGESYSHIHEMPVYRKPLFKQIFSSMWARAKTFVKDAGTVILGISIILWVGLNYPKPLEMHENTNPIEHSIVGKMGKALEPIFEPLGFDWRTNIAILSSFAAREVFVSTVNIVYNVENTSSADPTGELETTLRHQKRTSGDTYFTPLVCLSLLVFYVFALQCMSTVAVVAKETRSWRWAVFQFLYMTAFAYVAALIVYQIGKALGYA